MFECSKTPTLDDMRLYARTSRMEWVCSRLRATREEASSSLSRQSADNSQPTLAICPQLVESRRPLRLSDFPPIERQIPSQRHSCFGSEKISQSMCMMSIRRDVPSVHKGTP